MLDINFDRRLYVEYQPDKAGLLTLQTLQAHWVEAGIKGRPVPPHEFHVTLIHIGKFADIWTELQHYQPTVTVASLLAGWQQFIERSAQHMKAHGKLMPTGYTFFGPRRQVLGLAGDVDASLIATHQKCLTELEAMIGRCLKADPRPFIHQSRNLRYSYTLQPHITLVRSINADAVRIENMITDVPGNIELLPLPPEHNLKNIVDI